MDLLNKINVAVTMTKEGNYNSAELIFKELLAKFPNDIRILPFLGWNYLQAEKYNSAIEIFEQINKTTTNHSVITGLGLAYFGVGKYKEAMEFLKLSINKEPSFETLCKYIMSACENTPDIEEVFHYACKMEELYPKHPKTWECYILAALCAGKFDIAEEYCNTKLQQHPNNARLYLSAGLIQEVVYSNYELARDCYTNAYQIAPSNAALYNLGLICQRLKDYKNSEKFLKQALNNSPASKEINIALYITEAVQKNFNKAYEYFKAASYGLMSNFQNHWNGEPYINESLYIFADQGFGDIIMYARYLPYLKDYFKNVIVALPKQLILLFKENFPENFYTFVDREDPMPEYSRSTTLTLLPYLLKMDYFNIPSTKGYFKQFPNTINNDKLKVGIIWEPGGTQLRGPLDRTINLKLLAPLFRIQDTEIYSLQVNPVMKVEDYYPNATNLGKDFNNFMQTAHAISSMDVIVTADTSVAHLAGAMGKRTFILLPFSADWRWFNNMRSTEWYDSVELFSQPTPLDWTTPIKQICNKITELRQ